MSGILFLLLFVGLKGHQEDHLEFPSLQFLPKSFKSAVVCFSVHHLRLRDDGWLASYSQFKLSERFPTFCLWRLNFFCCPHFFPALTSWFH